MTIQYSKGSGSLGGIAILLAATSALAAVPAAAQDMAAGAASAAASGKVAPVRFGTWGVDISTRDLSVKPGDDFQRYASGKWLAANAIPADKSQNGVGSELNDRNQEQLRAIITSAPADSQLGALYAS